VTTAFLNFFDLEILILTKKQVQISADQKWPYKLRDSILHQFIILTRE
jgi:hypothetical protein